MEDKRNIEKSLPAKDVGMKDLIKVRIIYWKKQRLEIEVKVKVIVKRKRKRKR